MEEPRGAEVVGHYGHILLAAMSLLSVSVWDLPCPLVILVVVTFLILHLLSLFWIKMPLLSNRNSGASKLGSRRWTGRLRFLHATMLNRLVCWDAEPQRGETLSTLELNEWSN